MVFCSTRMEKKQQQQQQQEQRQQKQRWNNKSWLLYWNYSWRAPTICIARGMVFFNLWYQFFECFCWCEGISFGVDFNQKPNNVDAILCRCHWWTFRYSSALADEQFWLIRDKFCCLSAGRHSFYLFIKLFIFHFIFISCQIVPLIGIPSNYSSSALSCCNYYQEAQSYNTPGCGEAEYYVGNNQTVQPYVQPNSSTPPNNDYNVRQIFSLPRQVQNFYE